MKKDKAISLCKEVIHRRTVFSTQIKRSYISIKWPVSEHLEEVVAATEISGQNKALSKLYVVLGYQMSLKIFSRFT